MDYLKRFNPNSLTNETLLDELKKLADSLGRTPSQNDIKNYGNDITKRIYLYRRRFGSLQTAQEKIGYNKNLTGLEQKYTDQELLDEIKRIYILLGRTPTQKDINKLGKYPADAYKRRFKTYNNALKKLNIRHNLKFNVSKEEIESDIIRVTKILGRAPTIDEFNQLSSTVSTVTATSCLNCGNSWNDVLKQLNLELVNNRNISGDLLKEEIVKVKNMLNRVPGYHDMYQFGKYSPETYALRYGSYVKALEYFGFSYIPQNHWFNQKMIRGPDGKLYRSKFETNIVKTLSDLIKSQTIKSFEYERKICSGRNWTCDFYIILKSGNELWLEADGMGENRPEVYNENHEKIKYYMDNKFNFYILPYGNKIKEEILKAVCNEE